MIKQLLSKFTRPKNLITYEVEGLKDSYWLETSLVPDSILIHNHSYQEYRQNEFGIWKKCESYLGTNNPIGNKITDPKQVEAITDLLHGN